MRQRRVLRSVAQLLSKIIGDLKIMWRRMSENMRELMLLTCKRPKYWTVFILFRVWARIYFLD